MKIITAISDVRDCVHRARQNGKRIGLVPTMGALHAGHGALIERAVRQCDFVVVSIFVNPIQFGPNEDFDRYPRSLEQDAAYCTQRGVDVIFAPPAQEMYPDPQQTWVEVQTLTERLCGAARPGHFRGVTTVCAKLFNIVGPDVAYFGQKDAQQAIVIQRMVKDLNVPLDIALCPIVREPDGLAMSSRNRYLTPEQRRRAVCLYRALEHSRQMVAQGCRQASELIAALRSMIEQEGGQVEYVSVVDAKTLEPVETLAPGTLIAVAAFFGSTRLIDNCLLDLSNPQDSV